MYDSINDTNLKSSADPNTTFFDLMITQDINILKAVGKFMALPLCDSVAWQC